MKNNNKKISAGTKAAIGAGIAAVGAGAYYLLGPNKKEHQKKAAALIAKIKREVRSEAKKAKSITVPLYHKAVDVISEKYGKQYAEYEKDIKAFAKKLKQEWHKAKK